jgi:hypothetical protein
MHRGELATVAAMRRAGAVGAVPAVAWAAWLRAKYLRRVLLRTGRRVEAAGV